MAKKAIEEGREENELERKMHDAAGKATLALIDDDDEILIPAASAPLPGKAEAHSVPLTGVLPQQAQQVEATTTSTSASSSSKQIGGEGQHQQDQSTVGEVVVDDDTPLEALRGTEGLRVRFSDQPQGVQSVLPGEAQSRNPASTRPTSSTGGETAEASPTKRLKATPIKKLKLRQIEEETDEKIRTISFGGETFYTVDEDTYTKWSTRLLPYEWNDDEDEGSGGVLECLWWDGPLDFVPPTPPAEVDRAADAFEVERLTKMGVMRTAVENDKEIQKVLTTRFVCDWRLKSRNLGEGVRRSRLVARDYAFQGGRRDDVYSPASSSHLLRLLACLYLEQLSSFEGTMQDSSPESPLLGCIDFQDAFLQVPQEEPLRLRMGFLEYIVLKNVPGQRIGARAWFDCVSKYLEDEFGMESCPLSPCLAKNTKMSTLIHVDDMMIFGGRDYVMNHFLPKVKEKFNISVNVMEKPGDKIYFFKRSYLRVSDGLVVMPGSYTNNMLGLYESNFGM